MWLHSRKHGIFKLWIRYQMKYLEQFNVFQHHDTNTPCCIKTAKIHLRKVLLYMHVELLTAMASQRRRIRWFEAVKCMDEIALYNGWVDKEGFIPTLLLRKYLLFYKSVSRITDFFRSGQNINRIFLETLNMQLLFMLPATISPHFCFSVSGQNFSQRCID